MRTMKSGAALAGGGNAQLVAQLLQPLAHSGTAVQAGDVKVHITAPEYAEYAADCATRVKKDDAEKKKELAETVAIAVKVALAELGRDRLTSVDVHQKKAKSKKSKVTAPPETDSDAAGDLVSSSDSDSAPPSPAAKAKAKRQRQKKKKRDAAAQTQKVIEELLLFKDTVTNALADPASDDDGHNQVKMGQLKRNLRVAVRDVEKTTP